MQRCLPMTEEKGASVPDAKGMPSIFHSLPVTTLTRVCICSPCYSPWPLAALMLAAAPSPRGFDANLAVAGFVVGTFHNKSLPSRYGS